MSAKKPKQSAHPAPSPAAPAPASSTVAAAGVSVPPDSVAWIDSNDPRRRTTAKIALVVVWVYVAALWLLALDQALNWGIFGPKLPSLP